ncbi:LPXTG cell wall anchor domain-containing protein [Sphingomonas endolithica]|jgi:LPXTG-motif cell wall-anchored protein|uniref:LPXTG cell wall anchor domain-containing protein n=1 Tax=Sphingomonas endolithica TaxID=2972485 RepID=UPI0021B039ED|nr:LPXTG cell wall anchor domain-containing protein [Sphingomonas sp. ZFBP2030]
MNTETLTGIGAAAPAIAMLGAFACVGGGVYLLVKRRDRTKGVLMLVMAIVLFANVLIWTAGR